MLLRAYSLEIGVRVRTLVDVDFIHVVADMNENASWGVSGTSVLRCTRSEGEQYSYVRGLDDVERVSPIMWFDFSTHCRPP